MGNNKIFVLTDNLQQYISFKKIIERKKINNLFYFYCSPGNITLKDKLEEININEHYQNIINEFQMAFSIHSKQLFPKVLVSSLLCINVHPGHNPENRGWYPQVFSIIENKIIGATIHVMDEKLDNGPIIGRKEVEKYIWDTSESLYNRVLKAEIELLDKHLISIINNDFSTFLPEKSGRLYLKKDFNNLCEFEFNAEFSSFYNRIRALSHGEHNNAYFVDPETKKKIFFKIEIIKEGK